MTSATTPPELAGIERAVDAALLAFTSAEMRGDVVGVGDFKEALIRTHTDWIDSQVTPLLGPYAGDNWLPVEVVVWLSAAWSSVVTDHMAIVTDLLFEIQKLTGKTPSEALCELRERAERAVNDAE